MTMIFLRNFSLVILCTLFIFSSCDSSKKETFRYSKYVEEDKPLTVLQTLENENSICQNLFKFFY